MRLGLRQLTVIGLALGLAGCGSGGTAEPPMPTTTPTTTPTPTPTPTVAAATEQQVASVIATYESDWRKTIDSAGECRFRWVTDPGSIEGTTCWWNEGAIVLSAGNASRQLDELTAPPSMEGIVGDTIAVLDAITSTDLATACGDTLASAPSETDVCTEALGSLMPLYADLETQLDAWGPYM